MKKTVMFMMLMLLSQVASAADLMARDAWVRLAPPVAQSTAAYLILQNTSGQDVQVIGVTSSAATSSDLHGMRMQDGKMLMFPMDSVTVPAHGEFRFEPGGSHIMLMGLTQPLHEGDAVTIVLHLADGDAIELKAPVRDTRMEPHGHAPAGMPMHQGVMH